MAITSIKIQNGFGNTLAVIRHNAVFSAPRYSGIGLYTYTGDSSRMDMYSMSRRNMLSEAYDAFMSAWNRGYVFERYRLGPYGWEVIQRNTRYVSRISQGGLPNADGQLYVNTDSCLSWKPGVGGTYVTGYKSDALRNNYLVNHTTAGVPVASAVGAGSLTLFDTCVPCPSSCDTAMLIRNWFEDLKMRIDEMKDLAYIYDTDTNTQRSYITSAMLHYWSYSESVVKRLTYMWHNMTPLAPNCHSVRRWTYPHLSYDQLNYSDAVTTANDLKADWDSAYFNVIPSYVTMVHMWNYCMMLRSIKTTIEAAPEDPSGFVVNSCANMYPSGGKWKAKCTISLGNTYGETDNVSVFVTDVNGYSINLKSVSDTAYTKVDDLAYTMKRITSEYQDNASGAFHVTAKFLPFIYAEYRDVDGTSMYPGDTGVLPVYGDSVTLTPPPPEFPDESESESVSESESASLSGNVVLRKGVSAMRADDEESESASASESQQDEEDVQPADTSAYYYGTSDDEDSYFWLVRGTPEEPLRYRNKLGHTLIKLKLSYRDTTRWALVERTGMTEDEFSELAGSVVAGTSMLDDIFIDPNTNTVFPTTGIWRMNDYDFPIVSTDITSPYIDNSDQSGWRIYRKSDSIHVNKMRILCKVGTSCLAFCNLDRFYSRIGAGYVQVGIASPDYNYNFTQSASMPALNITDVHVAANIPASAQLFDLEVTPNFCGVWPMPKDILGVKQVGSASYAAFTGNPNGCSIGFVFFKCTEQASGDRSRLLGQGSAPVDTIVPSVAENSVDDPDMSAIDNAVYTGESVNKDNIAVDSIRTSDRNDTRITSIRASKSYADNITVIGNSEDEDVQALFGDYEFYEIQSGNTTYIKRYPRTALIAKADRGGWGVGLNISPITGSTYLQVQGQGGSPTWWLFGDTYNASSPDLTRMYHSGRSRVYMVARDKCCLEFINTGNAGANITISKQYTVSQSKRAAGYPDEKDRTSVSHIVAFSNIDAGTYRVTAQGPVIINLPEEVECIAGQVTTIEFRCLFEPETTIVPVDLNVEPGILDGKGNTNYFEIGAPRTSSNNANVLTAMNAMGKYALMSGVYGELSAYYILLGTGWSIEYSSNIDEWIISRPRVDGNGKHEYRANRLPGPGESLTISGYYEFEWGNSIEVFADIVGLGTPVNEQQEIKNITSGSRSTTGQKANNNETDTNVVYTNAILSPTREQYMRSRSWPFRTTIPEWNNIWCLEVTWSFVNTENNTERTHTQTWFWSACAPRAPIENMMPERKLIQIEDGETTT